MVSRKNIILGVIALASIGVFFIPWGSQNPDTFRCPNGYETVEAYIEGVAKWASEELKKSPDMTRDELLDKRTTLFSENGCERSRWADDLTAEI